MIQDMNNAKTDNKDVQKSLGTLLSKINMDDRWVYTGSNTLKTDKISKDRNDKFFTNQPCNDKVYWNILRTVMPLELENNT
jgi:hypothetical protein